MSLDGEKARFTHSDEWIYVFEASADARKSRQICNHSDSQDVTKLIRWLSIVAFLNKEYPLRIFCAYVEYDR